MPRSSAGAPASSGDLPREVQRLLKPRRTALKVLAAIIVALLVLYGAVRLVLSSNLRAEQRKIRERGEPVTLQELAGWYAMPGAGEANAADLYGQVFNLMNQAGEKYGTSEESLPVVGEGKLPPRGEAMPEEMRKGVEEYLARRTQAMALLHQAATVERCRYPVDFAPGYGALLDHLTRIREAARALNLQALVHAESGRPDEAAESLADELSLADSLAQEPLLISQLVRTAVGHIVLDATERVLSHGPIADGQAQRLAQRLKAADTSEPIYRGFAGERCIGATVFTMGSRELREMASAFWQSPSMGHPVLFAPWKATGLCDAEHRHYLQLLTQVVEGCKQSPAAAMQAGRDMEASVTALPKVYVVTRMIAPALGAAVVRELRGRAEIRAAMTALAIERYRLAKGRLPEKLEELVPEFLEAVPEDPLDPSGATLRYRRLDKGYVVYSVGENGADDGGAETAGPGSRPLDTTFTVAR